MKDDIKISKMACMTAETGTLIFAIINIIIVILGFTADLIGVVYTIIMYGGRTSKPSDYVRISMTSSYEYNYSRVTVGLDWFVVAMHGVFLLSTLITLVFSSLLLDGILKKRPGYVKAYFIYGVLVVVVTMLALIGCLSAFRIGSFCIVPIIIAYVIYCSILYMIRCAYTNMEAGTVLYEPKPLIAENEYC